MGRFRLGIKKHFFSGRAGQATDFLKRWSMPKTLPVPEAFGQAPQSGLTDDKSWSAQVVGFDGHFWSLPDKMFSIIMAHT